jgi:hypothetical protein
MDDLYEELALAILLQAISDVKNGDSEALGWLRSTGVFWLEVLSGESFEWDFFEGRLINKESDFYGSKNG